MYARVERETGLCEVLRRHELFLLHCEAAKKPAAAADGHGHMLTQQDGSVTHRRCLGHSLFVLWTSTLVWQVG